MPKGSQRPYTKEEMKQFAINENLEKAKRSTGLASDLYVAKAVDINSGRTPVKKKTQRKY